MPALLPSLGRALFSALTKAIFARFAGLARFAGPHPGDLWPFERVGAVWLLLIAQELAHSDPRARGDSTNIEPVQYLDLGSAPARAGGTLPPTPYLAITL